MIRFKLWHYMATIAALAVTCPVWSPLLAFALLLQQGCCMQSYVRTAERARLAGKPESEMVTLFGRPTSIHPIDDSPGCVVHTYGSLAGLEFDVFCRNGVVVYWWVDD